ncbi:MAG: hypothetical protein QM586_04635 [Xenophilus sp.]
MAGLDEFLTFRVDVFNEQAKELLSLTEEGRRTVQKCNRLGRRMQRSLLSVLSESETALFDRCLARLTAQLERDSLDRRRFLP